MLTIILLCIFSNKQGYDCKKYFQYSNYVYLLFGILGIALVFLIAHCFCTLFKSEKVIDSMIRAASILFGVIISVFSYHYYFKTGWDVEVLVANAYSIAHHDFGMLSNEYFSMYPNNILLTYIFSIIIRISNILGAENYYFSLIFFQCMIYAYVGYIVYRSVDIMLLNKKYGVFAWGFYTIFIGMSPWVVVPYSDSVGLFFVATICFLYLKIKSGIYVKRNIFLLTLFSYLGFKIKPQILIIAIAIGIITIVEYLSNKNGIKEWPGKAYSALMGFFCAILLVNGAVSLSRIQIDHEKTLGVYHFLMMGLNEERNGVYLGSDVDFSASFDTRKERNAANLQIIHERLADYKLGGILQLAARKMLTVYNDGTFAWNVEGNFFRETYSTGYPPLQIKLKNLYYPEGTYYNIFMNMQQMLWLVTLFLAFLAFLKNKNPVVLVLMLSIIGLTLFELLFEVKARYLLAYTPIFIILASIGLDNIISSRFCQIFSLAKRARA